MGLICAQDEAGRGPVIGPLVMAGILIDEKDVDKLRNINVKDSKLLSKQQRERLFDSIKEIVVDYKIIIVGTNEVDDAVNGKFNLNLNWLEANKAADIVNEFSQKHKIDKTIIDCPSNNIKAYTEYMRNKINNSKIKLVVEHKADMNYVEVGAASILAKVTRDNEIEKIKQKLGINFGSGYPSDPLTQKFLEKYWDKFERHNIFRKSWKSWQKLKQEKAQTGLFDY